MEIVTFILFSITIILLSAFISGSEAAILSVSYGKIKSIYETTKNKKEKEKAKQLLEIKENIRKYITTIVILNNIINIIGSIYVGLFAAQLFGNTIVGIISGIFTFLIILFSEIIPKVYGETHSLKISLLVTPIIVFFTKILYPIVLLLNKIASLFVKKQNKKIVSESEIKAMAEIGFDEGSINDYEKEVIRNVFEMEDIEVFEIMIPKNKVQTINIKDSFEKIISIIKKTGYTRFPIIKEEEIIGLLHVKDLFKYYNDKKNFNIQKIMRKVIYAPETMKIFTLQEKLKKSKTHMAIVVNEFGDYTGIVTLEDIIEEMIGDIKDEFDREEKNIEKKGEKKYHVNADINVEELNEKLNLKIPEQEEYTTLNGYITYKLDRIPKNNDIIKEENYTIRVIEASKKKAIKTEITKK